MWKYLNSFHKGFFVLFLLPGCITPQRKESDNSMPEFYRDDITKPLQIDVTKVDIKPVKEKSYSALEPEEYPGGYFFRYLNAEKNSRLLSEFKPNKIWEVKWQSQLDSNLFPWFLLLANDRIVVQNQSGWQLFDTNGKMISSSGRTDGNLSIDHKNSLFYQNEFSGFLQANNLNSGNTEFLVYPYFGKGYERSVLWFSDTKFLSIGNELMVMTHKSSSKEPDITLFEVTDVTDKSEIDPDKILNSSQQFQKLIMKAKNIKTAVSKETIVAASDNFISIIDIKLDVKKIFQGKFIPLELSLDGQLNVYLIVKVAEENNSVKFYLWMMNLNGELLRQTELPLKNDNYEFYPPVVGTDLSTFIITGNKIFSVNPEGVLISVNNLTDNCPGGSIALNGYILVPEGNILTAMESDGHRNFIYKFEEEQLFTPPILTPQNEIYIASKNFLYCLQIKQN
jgi:hypothetical protein